VRLAVHSYPFRALPLEAALEEIARLDVGLVDLWVGHAATSTDDAARQLDARGLRAVAVSAGGLYDEDDETAARAVALAERLEAPVIAGCLAPEVASWVAERMPLTVAFAIENHWDQLLARSSEVAGVLASQPRLRACLDTGHALLAGERPEEAATVLGDRLAHVHLKEALLPAWHERLIGRRARRRLLAKPAPSPPGEGMLDVAAMRLALDAIGYAGAVAVEYEGPDPGPALTRLVEAWRRAG
jgi:sugar phosphate isomerase/epimerase